VSYADYCRNRPDNEDEMSIEVQNTATIAAEPAEDYHADTEHVSASMLKTLAESPQKFHAKYIAGTLPDDDSDALRFGRWFHLALLEPDEFKARCIVPPKCDRRTTVGKQAWAEFCAANPGKEYIDAATFATLIAMQAAVLRHDDAKRLMQMEGKIEHAIRWEDRCWRKARPDKIIDGHIIDVKTVANPSPQGFSAAAGRFGWALQAAWYLDGVQTIFDGADFRFLFIAVGKTPPHEVAVYQLDDEPPHNREHLPSDLSWAEQRCEELVTELMARRVTGDWSAGWQKGICTAPLPAWVRSSFYSVEGNNGDSDSL
jgi:hypothetical protein